MISLGLLKIQHHYAKWSISHTYTYELDVHAKVGGFTTYAYIKWMQLRKWAEFHLSIHLKRRRQWHFFPLSLAIDSLEMTSSVAIIFDLIGYAASYVAKGNTYFVPQGYRHPCQKAQRPMGGHCSASPREIWLGGDVEWMYLFSTWLDDLRCEMYI